MASLLHAFLFSLESEACAVCPGSMFDTGDWGSSLSGGPVSLKPRCEAEPWEGWKEHSDTACL